MEEIKRTKTPEQALMALTERCARCELAVSDVQRSLFRWGIVAEEQQKIIKILLKQGFIDEQRYADAYVREKVNLSRWGIHKIRSSLRVKQIPETVIEQAMEQVDPVRLHEKLEIQLRRKMKSSTVRSNYEMRGKLLRYGAGLGFDFDTVNEVVDRLVAPQD